jgi:hypothetical protein
MLLARAGPSSAQDVLVIPGQGMPKLAPGGKTTAGAGELRVKFALADTAPPAAKTAFARQPASLPQATSAPRWESVGLVFAHDGVAAADPHPAALADPAQEAVVRAGPIAAQARRAGGAPEPAAPAGGRAAAAAGGLRGAGRQHRAVARDARQGAPAGRGQRRPRPRPAAAAAAPLQPEGLHGRRRVRGAGVPRPAWAAGRRAGRRVPQLQNLLPAHRYQLCSVDGLDPAESARS